jgi:hypothetical protein
MNINSYLSASDKNWFCTAPVVSEAGVLLSIYLTVTSSFLLSFDSVSTARLTHDMTDLDSQLLRQVPLSASVHLRISTNFP